MLTELKLKNIKFSEKVTLHKDDNGLFLRVSKTKKKWQLSFMVNGKQKHFYAPKEYPLMSLAEARKWALLTREQATEGIIEDAGELSLGSCLDDFIASQQKARLSESTIKKLILQADRHIRPYAKKDIRSYTPTEILEILKPLEDEGKLESLSRVRSILSNVFIRAKIKGMINSNPCDGLNKVLAPPKIKSRAAVTDLYEFGELLAKIEGSKSNTIIRAALILSPLLFVRPNELRLAEWSEFDLDNNLWTIPGNRMKMKEDLTIPLSKQAKAIFQSLKYINGDKRNVFHIQNKTYTDATLRKELKRLGYYGSHQDEENIPEGAKFHSVHGFRASFRTIADEILEWRFDVIEQQLAHQVRDANGRAYNRTKHLDKRKEMMQLWADFCDVLKTGDKGKVNAFIKKYKGAI